MARNLSKRNVNLCVDNFGKAVVKRSRENLRGEKAMASGSLSRSIKYKWSQSTLSFMMNFYGAFMDKGVTGTGQLPIRSGPRGGMGTVKNRPVPYNKSEATPEYSFKSRYMAIGGSLKKWLQAKNLPANLDFVIRRSVHAKGIRPRRFFTEAYDREVVNFEKCLGRSVTEDVNNHLDIILKN